MGVTKLADIIEPEVFTDAVLEPSIYQSRLIRSGAVALSSRLNNLLLGGADTFNIKFFKDLSHTESNVPSETVALTPKNITQGKQIAARNLREEAWGSNALAGILSGDNPLAAIQANVAGYWGDDYDKTTFAILYGLYLDNVANNSGDLVAGSATSVWSSDLVIDARKQLGENSVVGKSNGDFASIVVNPEIHAEMLKNDEIDTIQISAQGITVERYQGMDVIVDRHVTVVAGTPDEYITYLLKPGALQFGETTKGFIPTELSRVTDVGFGVDILTMRKNFAIHMNGFSFDNTNTVGITPTNAEYAIATAWARVWEKENSGWVAVHSIVA